jgi:hypothetical protein
VPYLLSGPIVHAAHRRPGKGVFSLGLRVALPLVAGYVGAMTAECPQNTWDWDCSFSAMGKGMLVGAGIAVIADGILALTADIPISRDPEPPPARRGAVAPSFSVGAGNVGLGLRGTF